MKPQRAQNAGTHRVRVRQSSGGREELCWEFFCLRHIYVNNVNKNPITVGSFSSSIYPQCINLVFCNLKGQNRRKAKPFPFHLQMRWFKFVRSKVEAITYRKRDKYPNHFVRKLQHKSKQFCPSNYYSSPS